MRRAVAVVPAQELSLVGSEVATAPRHADGGPSRLFGRGSGRLVTARIVAARGTGRRGLLGRCGFRRAIGRRIDVLGHIFMIAPAPGARSR